MNKHRYILEPYKGMKTRYRCPSCNRADKTFSFYIDTETGEHIAPSVGRCNRESNCGYHYTPKQYFQDNGGLSNGNKIELGNKYAHARARAKCSVVTPQQKRISFIDTEVFKASLKSHDENNFVKFLFGLFGADTTSQLISRYFIATSKRWDGATVFWQIDTQGKVRTGKIMLYNPDTGKRIKEPFNHIDWVHTALKLPEFELRQCLFGEHLLQDKTKPVAIVESEKTALIASVYLPQFIWLAVGSLTNLNAEKCNVLKGRSVTLFPDLNGFEKWSAKAKEFSFTVSDLLERKASEVERKHGLDLADYLIRFDYTEFLLPQNLTKPNIEQPQETVSERLAKVSISKIGNLKKPESWEQDITKLQKYFESITAPAEPFGLNQYSEIKDVAKFIETHFATVKTNNGNKTFLPYLNRLQELKNYLTINSN